MEIAEFKNYAKDSATNYYKFLEKQGKGRSEIGVRTIKYGKPYFYITLVKRLPSFLAGENPKSLTFLIRGQIYSGSDVNPVEYDPQSGLLLVDPKNDYLRNIILSVSAEEMFVISDLKFLVKRVLDWYSNYGNDIKLPRHCTFPENESFIFYGDPPTDEQKEAIHGALTTPFSYIWGAPGTGKTRCVLANCVLNILMKVPSSQVLLIAPTNNAVEQMLFGIMPILEENGIPCGDVLRLGISSPQFVEEYKEACETHRLQEQICAISHELETISKYRAFLEFESKLSEFEDSLPRLFADLSRLCSQEESLSATLVQFKAKRSSLTDNTFLLEHDISHLRNSIHKTRIEIDSFGGKIKRFFAPSSYNELQRKLDAYCDALRFKSDSQKAIKREISEVNNSIQKCATSLLSIEHAALQLKNGALKTAPGYLPLKNALENFSLTSFDESVNTVSQSLIAAHSILNERRDRYVSYQNMSALVLSEHINQLKESLEKLQEESHISYSKKRIVAATIDRYISTFPSTNTGFSPCHIFMDEAAYCSLIKGATLLSSHVPVTLLGDHMQLPPVCEMNDESFMGDEILRPIFMWAQSSIYIDSIFHKSLYSMCEDYISGSAPDYIEMSKFDLTVTHRFGNAISSVLAGSVYDSGFRSATCSGTKVVALHAPRAISKQKRRVSPSECTSIARYLAEYSPIDYAILTPYRNQVIALSKILPEAAKENRILTVHASQGREYDTLIYSVVDTSDMYFVDSTKAIGKRVTNTAVSRAKRELVIACDCQFWRNQGGQLIADLINSADKILYNETSER